MHINIIYIYRESYIYNSYIFDDYIIHSYIIVFKDFMLTEKLPV